MLMARRYITERPNEELKLLGELSQAGCSLRHPLPNDLSTLTVFIRDAFGELEALYPDSQDALYVSRIMKHEDFSPQNSWILESMGIIVAACLVKECRFAANYISVVAVSPSYRGRGIGSLMVAKAISGANNGNAQYVLADVNSENVESIALFLKMGFLDATICGQSLAEHIRANSNMSNI
jgi:ribosomal protein S18 acetylase RimI-like enzyme